jgi:3-(methylthio)propionyl---CoA ligase
LLAFFSGKIAPLAIPDEVVFVQALPLTTTGKISKAKLREQFAAS